MAKIVIHIPNKELIYSAVNSINKSAQIGVNLGASHVKQEMYSGAMASEPIVLNSYTDQLRTEGSQYDNNLILKSSNGTQIEFIDAKIDVTRKNTIKETELINRSGKVKEFIQKDDYSIIVKGNLIADRDKFPYGMLNTLITILNEPESFEVANVYLDTFGICKLALKDAKFEQSAMKLLNVMPFTLTFTSDEDYDFLMIDE